MDLPFESRAISRRECCISTYPLCAKKNFKYAIAAELIPAPSFSYNFLFPLDNSTAIQE